MNQNDCRKLKQSTFGRETGKAYVKCISKSVCLLFLIFLYAVEKLYIFYSERILFSQVTFRRRRLTILITRNQRLRTCDSIRWRTVTKTSSYVKLFGNSLPSLLRASKFNFLSHVKSIAVFSMQKSAEFVDLVIRKKKCNIFCQTLNKLNHYQLITNTPLSCPTVGVLVTRDYRTMP